MYILLKAHKYDLLSYGVATITFFLIKFIENKTINGKKNFKIKRLLFSVIISIFLFKILTSYVLNWKFSLGSAIMSGIIAVAFQGIWRQLVD